MYYAFNVKKSPFINPIDAFVNSRVKRVLSCCNFDMHNKAMIMKKAVICFGLIWLGFIITAMIVYQKEQNARFEKKTEVVTIK